jgi:hypothetical protein
VKTSGLLYKITRRDGEHGGRLETFDNTEQRSNRENLKSLGKTEIWHTDDTEKARIKADYNLFTTKAQRTQRKSKSLGKIKTLENL